MELIIDVLIKFSRLVSETSGGHEILPLLADAAVDNVGADAAAVVEIAGGSNLTIVATRGLPEGFRARTIEADMIDEELGAELLAACDRRFARAHSLPMVSGGGLFGALVLFFKKARAVDARHLELATGLVDLAAIALGKAAQIADVTRSHAEVRASQDVLQRTEKLRALGQMAAGLSHDLKNVLNPIALHLQVAKRALVKGDTSSASESIDEIQVTVRRATEMLERLRDFSRQSPEARLELVDLNRIVKEAAELARPRMGSRKGRMNTIHVATGAPPPVLARAGEALSAVVNLVVNAIDAMPNGGTIELRTGESRGGGWVQVKDDGPGMTADVQQRVFEPFFTTKGDEGTGLGLAMVYACMQRHGGSVSLETAPGKGASFMLWFPAATGSPSV